MPKFVPLLGPIGVSLACFFSSLTCYSILCEMSSKIRSVQEVVLPSGHFIGAAGLSLFGMAVMATTLTSHSRSVISFILLMCSVVAFAVAAIAVTLGNLTLHYAFSDLFNEPVPDTAGWLLAAERAKLPILIGWGFVLLGAIVSCAAQLVAKPIPSSSEKSLLRKIAIAAAFFATVIFIVSGIWSVISLNSIKVGLATAEVTPFSLVEGVRGVMEAAMVQMIGIGFCAIATLFMALTICKQILTQHGRSTANVS